MTRTPAPAPTGTEQLVDTADATEADTEADTEAATELAELVELAELAGRLRVATGLLVRRLRQHDPGHLSPAKLSALLTIEAGGPIRSGDLAARENVAAPTMTRLIGVLAEAGLVTRGPDPSDARGSLVTLAPAGTAALEAVRRERTSVLVARLRRLSDEQRAALVAALPALEALLED
jgi:DNA-binding MarR family transcriptional regulator